MASKLTNCAKDISSHTRLPYLMAFGLFTRKVLIALKAYAFSPKVQYIQLKSFLIVSGQE